MNAFTTSSDLPALPDLSQIRQRLAEKSLRQFVRLGWAHLDSSTFKAGWHIDVLCEHLEAVNYGLIRRLLLNLPPRHGKSLIMSVAWPAWAWIQDPEAGPLTGPAIDFLFTSYSHSLALDHGFKWRLLLRSNWFRGQWKENFRMLRDQDTKIKARNDKGGQRFNTSVDGVATGMGGDIICVDDAHNVKEAESDAIRQGVIKWWTEVMPSRLNDPNRGAFVVQGQRVHGNDISGYILEHEAANWTHVCLPARFEVDHPHGWRQDPRVVDGDLLWPEHMDEAALSALQGGMTQYAIAGQYQQRPAPREGGMFKKAWFEGDEDAGIPRRIVPAAEVPDNCVWWRHWDLADTERSAADTRGARTAGVKMGRSPDGRYWITDCRAENKEGLKRDKWMRATAEADGYGVSVSLPQDPAQAGKAQKRTFAQLFDGFNVRTALEGKEGSKVDRAEPFASQCEGGNVYLVEGPWNREFIEEVCLFPGGRRKDIVDACSGAYIRLLPPPPKSTGPLPVGPQVFTRPKEAAGYESGSRW